MKFGKKTFKFSDMESLWKILLMTLLENLSKVKVIDFLQSIKFIEKALLSEVKNIARRSIKNKAFINIFSSNKSNIQLFMNDKYSKYKHYF